MVTRRHERRSSGITLAGGRGKGLSKVEQTGAGLVVLGLCWVLLMMYGLKTSADEDRAQEAIRKDPSAAGGLAHDAAAVAVADVGGAMPEEDVADETDLRMKRFAARLGMGQGNLRGLVADAEQSLSEVAQVENPGNPPPPIQWPRVKEFTQRVHEGLKKYQKGSPHYVPPLCGGGDPEYLAPSKGHFLPGCAEEPPSQCAGYPTLEVAQSHCNAMGTRCGGVTGGKSHYELRAGLQPIRGIDGEDSWPKKGCTEPSNSTNVWEAFHTSVSAAIADPKLNMAFEQSVPVKDDGTIFVSLASYRDENCPRTVHDAFAHATNPDRVSVGIVQQNCIEHCMKGEGWGNTRRIVPGPPDKDCLLDFCETATGKKPCSEGRVRILRVNESESLGPFFARYLVSKLWRGEELFLQVDAHSRFESGWDETMEGMMKKTESYPNTVISNYPPSHDIDFPPNGTSEAPSGLCGCTFEDAGAKDGKMTIRLAMSYTSRTISPTPKLSLFIAAGFFAAHSSFLHKIPFDPYLPFIFMGEEMVLSVRFWTAGFDIYAPTHNFLRHHYTRKNGPKFWESIGLFYKNPSLHNALTDLVIDRIGHIVGYPENANLEQIHPPSLRDSVDKYGPHSTRPIGEFHKLAGLDMAAKTQHAPQWCSQ